MTVLTAEERIGLSRPMESLGGFTGRTLVLRTWHSSAAADKIVVPANPGRLWLTVQNQISTNDVDVFLHEPKSMQVATLGEKHAFQIDKNIPWTGAVRVEGASSLVAVHAHVTEASIE